MKCVGGGYVEQIAIGIKINILRGSQRRFDKADIPHSVRATKTLQRLCVQDKDDVQPNEFRLHVTGLVCERDPRFLQTPCRL